MAENVWELYYWPILAGRAEFVRVIFEEAGIPFKEINDVEVMVPMLSQPQGKGWPGFALPMIKKDDLQLSQTQVICKYLGKEFGLYPDNTLDEIKAEQINATIHDFISEGLNSFHGKNLMMSYFQQIEETQPYIKIFVETRLLKFLKYFENVLLANDNGDGYVVGRNLTYVDMGLMHALRATASQFPEEWNSYDDIPKLKAFKQRIEARPRLADYFQSARCKPFEGNSMM